MMTEIVKNKTIETPLVSINKRERRIELKGSSNPIDPVFFYDDLHHLMINSLNEFRNFLILDFYFDYINSGSTKWLFYILKNLQVKYKGKKIITVNWYYEDDDEIIQDVGEMFQSLLQLPFNVIQLKS